MAKTFLKNVAPARTSKRLKAHQSMEEASQLRTSSGRIWSPQQTAIFHWFSQAVGNLVVVARAGTGKTTTIIEAINFIPAGAAKILLCAFNKRIQVELQSRLSDPRAEAKTLHALGFAYVREQWGNVRLDDNVEWDRLDEATFQCGSPQITREERTLLKKALSRAKGTTIGEEDVADLREIVAGMNEAAALSDAQTTQLAEIIHAALKLSLVADDENRISFDDMLYVPVANGWVSPRFDWVVVDEAQDMNPVQLVLAQAACKAGGHLVFVGDDRQAIYGFRGADSGCLERLKDATHAAELKLTVTYRCPKLVVEEAAKLVPDFTAHESAPQGEVLAETLDRALPLLRPGDALLSRVNAPLVSICMELIAAGTPAVIAGRDIGKGLVEIVRKIKAVGPIAGFLEKLVEWHDQRVQRIVAGKGKRNQIEKKLEELEDRVACLRTIAETVPTVADLQAKLERLFQDRDDRRSIVTCSSIHKAKGLEWPRVFVLIDTLYMGKGGRKGGGEASPEEANIHYVAVTRAQETLVEVTGGLGR